MGKPPAVIHVGPYRYTVTFDENAIARASKKERTDLSGCSDHEQLTITLDPALAHDAIADTLLHETLHTLTEMSGIQFELGEQEDERLVRRLSPLLLDVLRRNPKLVAYLTSEE